jgi:hypothetical protein
VDRALKTRHVGQSRHEMAVDEDDPRPFDPVEHVGAGERRTRGVRRGRRGGGRRIAHEGAQVRVLPVLDAPVRQAARQECVERRGARLAQGIVGRERREVADERFLGLGADAGEFGHQAASAA